MRVISLFSGVGTFDYGFHLAGWETVYLCEWDPKAREVLSARFPGVPISPDVCQVRGADLPDAECIMFGSPCQDLSVAGKRGGLDGARSGLFREAIRIIREKREATNGRYPAFALWENVPGAFSSNGGRDFASVVWEFLNCGARDVGWRLLDAQFFGVPQRRRRIFLVADFAGERSREVLFEPEGMRRHPVKSRAPGKGITGALTGGFGSSSAGNPDDNRAQAGFLVPVHEVARCLTTRNQRQDADSENLIPVIASTLTTEEGQRSPRGDGSDNLILAFDSKVGSALGLSISENVSPTLLSGNIDNGGRGRIAIAFDYKASVQRDPMCGSVSPTLEAQDKTAVAFALRGRSEGAQAEIYGDGARAGALRAAGGGSSRDYVAAGLAVRRLTPMECERLQGMPDGWTDVNGMADSHRYRFMGNGGAAPVLKWIAERMGACL